MGEFQSYLGRSYKSRQLEIGYDLITPVDSPFSITSCTLSDRAERGNVEEGLLNKPVLGLGVSRHGLTETVYNRINHLCTRDINFYGHHCFWLLYNKSSVFKMKNFNHSNP